MPLELGPPVPVVPMVPIVPGTVDAAVEEVDSGASDDETLGLGTSLPVGPAVGELLTTVPVVGKLLAGGEGRPSPEVDSPGPVIASDDPPGNVDVLPMPLVSELLAVGAVIGAVLDVVSLGRPAVVEFENDG